MLRPKEARAVLSPVITMSAPAAPFRTILLLVPILAVIPVIPALLIAVLIASKFSATVDVESVVNVIALPLMDNASAPILKPPDETLVPLYDVLL